MENQKLDEYYSEHSSTIFSEMLGEDENYRRLKKAKIAAEKAGVKYAVALSCCTAALHLCVKLAGERLYGKPAISHGAVEK